MTTPQEEQEIARRYFQATKRLSKWKSVFAGWQLGTRPIGDPECDALRDHREVSILMRCELSAFTRLCVEKGIFTMQELQAAVADEADQLSKDYEQLFPGFQATDIGIDIDIKEAEKTTKNWRS